MAEVQTKEHMWVEFNYLPVTVELSEDQERLDVYTSEEAVEAAEEVKMTGCWFCYTPLTFNAFDTECEGSPAQKG